MKCLTLIQPWATLVAVGAKKIETRSWWTSYRGPLAIHAAKAFPATCINGCLEKPFYTVLRQAGCWPPHDLPRGCVLATCTLRDCIPTRGLQIIGAELAFGDYTPGRWAWVLEDVKRLPEPIPARGALGLWEWVQPKESQP